MQYRTLLAMSVMAAALAVSGCAKEDDPPANPAAGSGGTGGAGAGGSGGGGTSGDSGEGGTGGGTPTECDVPIVEDGTCVNTGEDNIACSAADANMPFTGACAPKGPACRRASNRARECKLGPNDPMTMEFRVQQSATANMPFGSGLDLLFSSAADRSKICTGEQCLLFRYTVPRENGVRVAGPSTINIGSGRYNCDGTFSFFNGEAAPDRADVGRTGADRWDVEDTMGTFDPTKEGVEIITPVKDATSPNRELACTAFPVVGKLDVDWEICTMGFSLTELPSSMEARDDIGSYDGSAWTRPGKYHVYAPMSENDTDIIDGLTQTYCQLAAFGPIPPAERTNITCTGTPRCVPVLPPPMVFAERTCPWIKLPDSLCPEPGEEGMFGCHLGDPNNVNQEEGYPTVDCTMEAPTSPVENEKGQCCDPLGESTTLPACNAYRIVNTFAATAAEITDDAKDSLLLCD